MVQKQGFLITVNSEIFARVLLSLEFEKSLYRLLLISVNHTLVPNFNVKNMCFNAIRKNKILTKISEFTVYLPMDMLPKSIALRGGKSY